MRKLGRVDNCSPQPRDVGIVGEVIKGYQLLLLGWMLIFGALSIVRATPCQTPFGTILGQSGLTIAYSNCNEDYVSQVNHDIFVIGIGYLVTGMEWQCVEYARRWVIQHFHYTFPEVDHAYQLWDQRFARDLMTGHSVRWQHFQNGHTLNAPRVGDLLIYDQTVGRSGHVAVVVGATLESISLAEQNYANAHWEGKHYARRLTLEHDERGLWSIPEAGVIGWMRVRIS